MLAQSKNYNSKFPHENQPPFFGKLVVLFWGNCYNERKRASSRDDNYNLQEEMTKNHGTEQSK
jgi:hypothetical protein